MSRHLRYCQAAKTEPLRVPIPVIDLHCDLLHFLATVAEADPSDATAIGCAIPHLRLGNVKLQVLAIYSEGGAATTHLTLSQSRWFAELTSHGGGPFRRLDESSGLEELTTSPGTAVLVAIENAAALCDHRQPLQAAFDRLGTLMNTVGPILYISLTHQAENRFGGGALSDVGLKADGKALLDNLDGKRIAVDLSHASDALAFGILNYTFARGLDIPVLASHSNFRVVFDHKRNLTDELALEIVNRKGLIGMNLLRAYLHPDDPFSFARHALHGIDIGAGDALSFGADYFYEGSHTDPARAPFFFREHSSASSYQSILTSLVNAIGIEAVEALAYRNALMFMHQIWSKETS